MSKVESGSWLCQFLNFAFFFTLKNKLRTKDGVSPPVKVFLLTVQRRFFCGSFLLSMLSVCYVSLSAHCCLFVTCWERADHLALLYVMFYCVFVTFQCGVLGQVWCLIVSISDLCLLSYYL